MNHKRIYRLYRHEGLAIRPKRARRRRSCRYREARPEAGAPNDVCASPDSRSPAAELGYSAYEVIAGRPVARRWGT